MAKIEKSDLRKVSYQEFGDLLELLTEKVKESGVKFDLVIPILRSGALPAIHIASMLGITNVLPVQYKYHYEPTETIEKKIEFPKLNYPLPESANILIADSNTMSAGIAKRAIADVRTAFPKATLYFASVNIDQSVTALDQIKEIFFAALSNERRQLSREEAEAKKITSEVLIFPWEDLEKQWADILAFSENS